MSHHKTRLPVGAAAAAIITTLSAAAALHAAPDPSAPPAGASSLVSHNEQGNFRLPQADTDIREAPPVPCPADHDANGAVTSADISAFLTTWMLSVGTGAPAGDFDGSGAVTSSDISAFITAWIHALTFGC